MTLRSIQGKTSLDDLMTKRDVVNQKLQQLIDRVMDPWASRSPSSQ